MDMDKIKKMSVEKLELEHNKMMEQLPKVEKVVRVINERLREAEDDIAIGVKPRFDHKKLRKDLKEASDMVFDTKEFDRVFDSLMIEAKARQNSARVQKRRLDFLQALANAVEAEMAGKPVASEDIELIRNIKKQGNVMRFLNRIHLIR